MKALVAYDHTRTEKTAEENDILCQIRPYQEGRGCYLPRGGLTLVSHQTGQGPVTFSVSAKKILTVQSKRATARSRWSGLYCTPRTSSDIFSVRTCDTVSFFLQVGGERGLQHLSTEYTASYTHLVFTSLSDTSSNSQNLTAWSALPVTNPRLSGATHTDHTAPS